MRISDWSSDVCSSDLWLLAHDGAGWLVFALLPGVLLLASGVSLLLMPGDSRTISLMAAGALFGMLLTLPAWAFSDLGTAFFAGLGSFASFLAPGRASIRRAPLYPGAAARSEEHTSDLKSLMRT